MTKALITGGAGFIGSHLADRLAADGYRIVVLDALNWGVERIAHLVHLGSVEVMQGDIRDEDFVRMVVSQGSYDVVYHLAALHYIPYCAAHPVETLAVNTLGTQTLLEHLKATPPQCFVFASTGDVYAPKESSHDEEDACEPFTIYGASKLFCERLVRIAAKDLPSTRFTIGRLFNTYGSRESNPHLIPQLIGQLRTEPRVVIGSNWPRRDYVDVRDVAEALRLLGRRTANSQIETFNIGTGEAYSVDDLIGILGEILGLEISVEVDPGRVRAVERPHLQAGIERLRSATGWQPRVHLRNGLIDLCVGEGMLANVSRQGRAASDLPTRSQ